MYHDTAMTHQHNFSTILIKVPTQLTELCYDNLIQMKMHADDSPISSLVWVLIIWQLKEPHTFYSAAGFHLYDPEICLQVATPSCWYGFSCHTGLKSKQLHEIPMNTQLRTWSPEGEHEPDQSLGEKRWNRFRFSSSLREVARSLTWIWYIFFL